MGQASLERLGRWQQCPAGDKWGMIETGELRPLAEPPATYPAAMGDNGPSVGPAPPA